MKNALVFLAIAILAVVSQAATVTWTSGTIYVPASDEGGWTTGNANKAKNGLASATYLIVDADTYSTYSAGGENLYNNWDKVAKSAIRSSGSVATGGGASASWTDPTEITKADGTVYCLALFTTKYNDQEMYIATSGTATVNDLGDVYGTNAGLASNVGSWSVAPVPEPCSVALLALGLAALGLKRKVA